MLAAVVLARSTLQNNNQIDKSSDIILEGRIVQHFVLCYWQGLSPGTRCYKGLHCRCVRVKATVKFYWCLCWNLVRQKLGPPSNGSYHLRMMFWSVTYVEIWKSHQRITLWSVTEFFIWGWQLGSSGARDVDHVSIDCRDDLWSSGRQSDIWKPGADTYRLLGLVRSGYTSYHSATGIGVHNNI